MTIEARKALQEAVRALGYDPDKISDQDKKTVAQRLSVLGKRPEHKGWGSDYVYGVLSGKIPAGKKFSDAILALYRIVVQGIQEDIAVAQPTYVKSAHNVHPGSLVLTDSVQCPQCSIWFIPVAKHQRFHRIECKREWEKEQKRKKREEKRNATVDR